MRRAIRPYLSLLLFFVVVHPLAFSQSAPTIISGSVTDATTGSPLPYAKVELCIAPTGKVQAATLIKTDGTYRLQADVPGEYQLKISCVGYQTLRSGILHVVEEGKEHRQSFELKGTDMALGEALVKGQNAASRVQQQAFNVQALETKKLENTTLDLAHAMGKISGVKIRETGGLGSDVRVSLGGFSGRHIKLFIDGVPMDGMGTAFGLNNIPAGLAKRIEVYKGVVPIELGGDALGGAVNIVTDEERRSRVNISYSYGSFNTHRSNIYAEHTTERGLYFSLNAYQNYSDNDYEVDAKIHDFETHIYEKNKRRVRSFHNAYHNEAAVAKLGVVDKPWAERLLVGFIGGYEYKEQQHASSMDRVFGERYSTATTLMPTLSYAGRFDVLDGLRVGLDGAYNFGRSYSADTARREYNWLGQYREYESTEESGELAYQKYRYRDNNATANLKFSLGLAPGHTLSFASTLTAFSRKGHDETEVADEASRHPQRSMKDVLGLSYRYSHGELWNAIVFAKSYLNYLESYLDPEGGTDYQRLSSFDTYWGGGVAATWFVSPVVQVKASYEHALRLPTSRELFGTGDGIELGTADLKPENSDNVNLGALLHPLRSGRHDLTFDVALSLRNVRDYIRRSVDETKGVATSSNQGKVRSWGIDAGGRYAFRDLFYVGGNVTYIDMRNMERYQPGTTVESTVYKDRQPNEPWLYGNVEAGFTLRNLGFKGSVLDVQYALSCVGKFTYDWSNYNGDASIPRQLAHDVFVSYTFGSEQAFTLAAECRNLTDERLYDNYNIQKPGRSFAFKLAYRFLR